MSLPSTGIGAYIQWQMQHAQTPFSISETVAGMSNLLWIIVGEELAYVWLAEGTQNSIRDRVKNHITCTDRQAPFRFSHTD
jgi:hypothetical protein